MTKFKTEPIDRMAVKQKLEHIASELGEAIDCGGVKYTGATIADLKDAVSIVDAGIDVVTTSTNDDAKVREVIGNVIEVTKPHNDRRMVHEDSYTDYTSELSYLKGVQNEG